MKDGGPAFPIPNATDIDGYVFAPEASGMSLRDWFAGQALQGIVAGTNANPLRASVIADGADAEGVTITRFTALMSYELADAMLAEREKERYGR